MFEIMLSFFEHIAFAREFRSGIFKLLRMIIEHLLEFLKIFGIRIYFFAAFIHSDAKRLLFEIDLLKLDQLFKLLFHYPSLQKRK